MSASKFWTSDDRPAPHTNSTLFDPPQITRAFGGICQQQILEAWRRKLTLDSSIIASESWLEGDARELYDRMLAIPSASIPNRSGVVPTLPRRRGELKCDRNGAWAVTRSPMLIDRQHAGGSLFGLHFHKKSRGIERSHSRWQTSFAPSQARKPPCSRKASRVDDSRS